MVGTKAKEHSCTIFGILAGWINPSLSSANPIRAAAHACGPHESAVKSYSRILWNRSQ
jgi:hypothetical protein